ncbi:hypothetical protein BJ508DRAFT_375432 [Ascobolus immersus RN42]|uniref:Uncharacterized protein n=1 Tax=Ascobolus immersus RN42 TaxID=1160509 RepID=A0A3N4IA64_ASCIM|nr:hypothetical protein BJ508DRAFT_375432 [Ascobolus immersus RN42]
MSHFNGILVLALLSAGYSLHFSLTLAKTFFTSTLPQDSYPPSPKPEAIANTPQEVCCPSVTTCTPTPHTLTGLLCCPLPLDGLTPSFDCTLAAQTLAPPATHYICPARQGGGTCPFMYTCTLFNCFYDPFVAPRHTVDLKKLYEEERKIADVTRVVRVGGEAPTAAAEGEVGGGNAGDGSGGEKGEEEEGGMTATGRGARTTIVASAKETGIVAKGEVAPVGFDWDGVFDEKKEGGKPPMLKSAVVGKEELLEVSWAFVVMVAGASSLTETFVVETGIVGKGNLGADYYYFADSC